MTWAWRLDKAKRTAAESFSGNGALISGGRWNHKGIRVVYASESLALAALERFVHVQQEGAGIAFVAYKIEIPNSVRIHALEPAELPTNWREQPVPRQTQDLGSRWLKNARAAALRVPSVIVPGEFNFLFNPSHADFSKIKILSRKPFTFDSRLWK